MSSVKRLLATLEKIERTNLVVLDSLTSEQMEEKALCESSFLIFVSKAWFVIEGESPFIFGWHVQAICEHLEALYHLDINRLIINCPPRIGKSNLCSVLFPAWVWTKSPHLSFLCSAYAHSLSIRDCVKSRRLIQSNWYQSLWGNMFKLQHDQNAKIRFDNNKGGYRIATSVGGSATGEGGSFEIGDDLNNVSDNRSEVSLSTASEWHSAVMSTRHAGLMSEFRRLVIQQRTHEKDITGSILATEDQRWIHLCLPMEFEPYRKCRTIVLRNSGGKVWEDPREEEGELLWPEGIGAEALHLLKTKDFRNDTYRISGQLQQRPSPAGGNILKAEWFKPWKHRDLPEFEYVLQSWDSALTKGELSCYSACTTWGIFKDKGGINNIMLLSVFREKVEYPDLRKAATRLSQNYMDVIFDEPLIGTNKPDLILIEAKVSGYSLLQDLMRANLPVMAFNPNKYGDKIGRCRLVSHLMENGLVWLPTEKPGHEYYTEDSQIFLEEAVNFPNGESNDVIDSMSQAFIRLTSGGWIMNKEDPTLESEPNWKKMERPYY